MKGISVVIPIYNEEESITEGYRELTKILSGLPYEYELIYVDDGSKDRSFSILRSLAIDDAKVVAVELRRNFGQTAAMAAGLQQSRYDIVVTLDGDLQNDPSEIPKMVAKLEEGYDLVAGWRKDRQDAYINRKLPSMIANWVISKSTRVRLHDYGCTLKVMTGEVARGIKLYGEMHRFIPALADEFGARIAEIPVKHRPRKFGTSKYGISRTIRVILDLITVKFLLGYSKRPIHLFGSMGFLAGGVGMLTLLFITYQRFFQHVPMGNRPLLSLAVMLVIIGLQFVVFGLLAEVLARTYHESQKKPIYSIRNVFRAKANDDEITQAMRGAAWKLVAN